jgi:hypothetical protein
MDVLVEVPSDQQRQIKQQATWRRRKMVNHLVASVTWNAAFDDERA